MTRQTRRSAWVGLAAVALVGCTPSHAVPAPATESASPPPLSATSTATSTATATATATATPQPAGAAPRPPQQPATPAPGPAIRGAARFVHKIWVFGHSVRGVPLEAVHVGDPSRPAVLVVGCIHGDERAGVPIARRLAAVRAADAAHLNLWVVLSLNPDGAGVGTRTNARGVDLNRNFDHLWGARGSGTTRYGGPSAASEPETRAMTALLLRIHPVVGIWFHQALDLVDDSEGPPGAEAFLARALRLPEQALKDFGGSAIGYENAQQSRSGFAVELPPGRLSSAEVVRAARAILTLAASTNPARPRRRNAP